MRIKKKKGLCADSRENINEKAVGKYECIQIARYKCKRGESKQKRMNKIIKIPQLKRGFSAFNIKSTR